MYKGKILEIVYHPAFISLILWILLIIFIPWSVTKYRIRTVSEDLYPRNLYYIYCDLNSDGSSEKISLDLNDAEQTKVIVYKDDKVLDQYDVAFHPASIQSVYFGDYNGDSNKEIFIFTLNDNALFLSIIDPAGQRKALISNRLIDHWRKSEQSIDRPSFVPVGMPVNPDLQVKDFVFFVSTGYSLQPRNLYRYILDIDSLIKSPESFATINRCYMLEMPDQKSGTAFLLSIQASGNVEETRPFSDRKSWLMLLNGGLEFSFKPVKTGEHPSMLHAIPVNTGGNIVLMLMNDYFGSEDIKSMFYMFDINGNKLKEKVIDDYEPGSAYIFANESDGRKSFFFLRSRDGIVDQLDTSFSAVRTCTLPDLASTMPVAYLDADMDGNSEYFFAGRGNRSLVISSADFRHATEYKLNVEGIDFIISPILSPGMKPMIHLQIEKAGWVLMHEKNMLYYLRYPVLIMIYLLIFLVISVLYRIQKQRLELKIATGKELASLQMRAIKNQIDPHFTLNVLNSIGSLYYTEKDRKKADYIFGRYASLIRQTVISSDKVVVSLEDEVDFVRNYIDLERFRCENRFDYEIDIAPGINMEARVPRMLIHSFVENSIKYALKPKAGGGKLRIAINDDVRCILISIEDNGPGLINDGISPGGTGKGLKIVNELVELYYRLEKVKITTSLENILQSDNSIAGTRATILLPAGRS